MKLMAEPTVKQMTNNLKRKKAKILKLSSEIKAGKAEIQLLNKALQEAKKKEAASKPKAKAKKKAKAKAK